MKNFLLGLFVFGLTSHVFSQNEIAMVISPMDGQLSVNSKSDLKPSLKNSFYLSASKTLHQAKRVNKFHALVAHYNIKNEDCYSKNRKGNYTVNFKETYNQITAIYNHNGEVLSTSETYTNVKLPLELGREISEIYPEWSIKKVVCKIRFNKNTGSSTSYRITLKDGKKQKIVTMQ